LGGAEYFTLSERQHLVWDIALRNTKLQDMLDQAGVAKLRLFEPLHAALRAFRKIIYFFFISCEV